MPEFTFRMNNLAATEVTVVGRDIYEAEYKLLQFAKACHTAWNSRNMESRIIDCVPVKTPKVASGRDKV